jgi:hypothetical protein
MRVKKFNGKFSQQEAGTRGLFMVHRTVYMPVPDLEHATRNQKAELTNSRYYNKSEVITN